jgi:hypothetical protein
MSRRDASRNSQSRLHLIVIVALVAVTGFSVRGWALSAVLPPTDSQRMLVVVQFDSMSNEQKALSYICRAAELPHGSLPAQKLGKESALKLENAKGVVEAIQDESKTQTLVCSPDGVSMDSAVEAIRTMARRHRGGDTDPHAHDGIHPNRTVSEILDQVEKKDK